jgi:hypothetical protein
MATTLKDVMKIMDNLEVPYFRPEKGDDLLVPLRYNEGMTNIFLELQNEGEILEFNIRGFLVAPDPRKADLMEALLSINYRWKLIKFSMDPSDGEITVGIDLFLGGAELEGYQFSNCMDALSSVISRHARELREILYGEKSETPEEAHASADLIGQLETSSCPEYEPGTGDDSETEQSSPSTSPEAAEVDIVMEQLLGDFPHTQELEEKTAAHDSGIGVLSKFVEEECEKDTTESGVTEGAVLFSAYASWAGKSGEFCLRKREFNALMRELGFATRNRNREFVGIRLKSTAQA